MAAERLGVDKKQDWVSDAWTLQLGAVHLNFTSVLLGVTHIEVCVKTMGQHNGDRTHPCMWNKSF
jgi:hypothetical protein